MKKILLFLSFSLHILSPAQTLTRVNCMDEGLFEQLKLKENLDDNNYLLYSKSFLQDSVTSSSPFYWLHKVNGNGNVVWKQQVPNSDKGYYNAYLPNWVGYFTFKVNDFPYKIFSKVGDELILHYAYYDSISIDSAGYHMGNDILTFAVMKQSDGSYRSSFINIDTLISNPLDTGVQITNCLVNKINDSIYQMAVQYSKNVYWFWTNIYAYSSTSFYTININSHQVKKRTYRDYFYSISVINNRFYALRSQYISYNINNVFLSRIDMAGEADTTLFVIQTPYGAEFIETPQGAAIQLLCNTDFEPNKQNRILVSVDTAMFISNSTQYNQFIDDAGIISGYENIGFVDYPVYNNSMFGFNSNTSYTNRLDFTDFRNKGNKRFVIHSYEYYDSTNTNQRKRFISRLNLDNGNIEVEIEVQNTMGGYINELFRDDILPGNEILVPNDSVTALIYSSDTIFQQIIFQKHLISLSKLDSNLHTNWSITFPESIMADSLVYDCGFTQFSETINFNYFPVNYQNQFIVSISYNRLLDSVTYTSSGIIKYFLVNISTGEIRDMYLPSYLSQSTLVFFNSPTNDLSIITHDSCSGNSADIAIYKYSDVLSGTKPVKTGKNIDFSLYPNPASESVTIQLADKLNGTDVTLRVVDISGKIVQSTGFTHSSTYTLDVRGLSNGMYFIQLQSNEESITRKLQVIR